MKHTSVILVFISFILLSGCLKDRNNDGVEIYPARDMGIINSAFEDAFSMVDRVGKSEPGLRNNYGLPECATVVFQDTLQFPYSVVIDFGEENCMGMNGVNRRGKIHFTISGPYQEIGTVITTWLEDYHVMDYLLTGTRVVTNQGENASGNQYFTVVENDVTLTHPDGIWTSTWESERIREWVQGAITALNPFDDEYSVTGSAAGVSREGEPYVVEIEESLIVKLVCPWVTSGTITLYPDDNLPISLDYGDGMCDSQAVVTVGGATYDIILNN